MYLYCCYSAPCQKNGSLIMIDVLRHKIEDPKGPYFGKVELQTGPCLGLCSRGPVVFFEGRLYEQMDVEKSLHLLDEALRRGE